jgi:hypothetical protein
MCTIIINRGETADDQSDRHRKASHPPIRSGDRRENREYRTDGYHPQGLMGGPCRVDTSLLPFCLTPNGGDMVEQASLATRSSDARSLSLIGESRECPSGWSYRERSASHV